LGGLLVEERGCWGWRGFGGGDTGSWRREKKSLMSWDERSRVPFDVRREMRASVCWCVSMLREREFFLLCRFVCFLLQFLFPFFILVFPCLVVPGFRKALAICLDVDFGRTNKLLAVAFAGERFGAFVHPVDVLVYAVLRCQRRQGFGDAGVELGFGGFVSHGR
jgi:hypothetical protein